jgi:DNA-binding SARP family transcriptional activator/class 3 adenylate cyclase
VVTRFGVLGPVEVEGAAGPIAVRGAKRRALLVRLLVSANQQVPIDRLADDLWDGAPGLGAPSTLASHISLLRHLLGPERIANHLGSYRITVDPGELDVIDFESAVAAGHLALRQGSLRQAADQFELGLGFWRGPALADVSGAGWAQGEIARLEEMRFGTEESLLDARMALGLHREVVAAAEAAANAQPLREQRWATLMLALYRSGRQADALRTYQRLYRLLGDELGLEPSTDLTALEDSIIRHSPELDRIHSVESSKAVGTSTVVTSPPVVAPVSPPTSGMVTLVFADWVGSTAHSTNMTVDGSEALRHSHVAVLRDALAKYGGREVKALGHGLMAVFSSPSAALAAAAAMQQGIERHNRRSTVGAGLRIGLSAGEVSWEDGGYYGDPVVEAARLCGLAESGQVLVAGLVRTLAGRRSRLRFSDLGELELRGMTERIPTLSLEWEPLVEEVTVIPFPEALATEGPGFFGRTSEQTQLSRLFALASRGKRQVVLIGGEPGIGKTTLATVLAHSVEDAGGTVLYGRCLDTVSAPYQPFVETLGHYVQHAPREQLDTHLSEFGGELARLVPSLARRVPEAPPPSSSDPDSERYLAFGAAVGLLTEESDQRPVLLILDDLHWADAATLQLLRHLAVATPRVPLLILGTFRSNEVTDQHPLADVLAAFRREEGVTRVELTGLSPADVFDLCTSVAGHMVEGEESSDFAEELQRDTAGNPYFVWELLRHLVESGGLVRDDSMRWNADRSLLRSGLPASLREVIAQRVQHLGPHAGQVLNLASVIGVEFDLATLVRVADASEDDVLDVIETAEQSALLHSTGDGDSFTFAHALIRNTIYEALRPARRHQIHAKVASALESGATGPLPPALLAYHFSAAGEQRSALHYAELAGHSALDSIAPDEAVRWFREARSLLETLQPDASQRLCDLTTQLGVAQRLAGDPAYRETLLQAVAMADAAGDALRMAVAALANTRGYYSSAGENDQERVVVLRSSLECLGASDARLRVRLLATLCSEMVFDSSLGERRAMAGQAKEEAALLGDPGTLVDVHNLVIEALRHPTLLAERLEDTAVALALAEDLGDPAAYFWAVSHRMRTTMEAGMVAESRELNERMTSTSSEVGQPVMRWMTMYSSAQWAFLRGESAVGEKLADDALAYGIEIGQPDAVPYYATQLSHARWQQGRLGEIVELIEVGARDNPGIPSYNGALARAMCQAGREQEASALLDKATANRFADLPEDLLWTYGMVTFGEAAIQLGHVEAAAVLYEQLVDLEDQFCFLGTTCEGPIAHYLGGLAGVVGRLADAEQHLKAAAVMAESAGSPYFSARTAIERGRVAAHRRDLAVARGFLSEGRELAGRWGFADEARRVDAALIALN